MRNLVDQDLFEVLQIGFREDSYMELIANVFENDEETALEFLRQSFPDASPTAGPVSAKTRVPARTASGGKIIPDLLVCCGDEAETELYVIEAKIEAAEGDRQTKRYLEAQEALLGRYPGSAARGIGFLTLDGRAPSCDGVKLLTYELLVDLLRPERFADHPWMQVAVETLRRRLADYYATKERVEHRPIEGKQSLKDFLAQARGLITRTDLFHWLTSRVQRTDEFEFRTEEGVAHNSGTAHPLRTFYLPNWQSKSMEDGCSLADCRWIHVEVQMAPEADDVVYMLLHYETYPYDSGIADTILRGQNSRYCLADYEQYWQRRSRFVSALAGELRNAGFAGDWKPINPRQQMPKKKNVNQVTRQIKQLDFTVDQSVEDFEQWLRSGLKGISGAVDRALLRAD